MNLLKVYVLHTRPWRDSSLLVDLLVQHHGRVRAIARGQRRQSSRQRGNICQPFRPLLAGFSGRGELKTVSRLEADGPMSSLPGERLYAGFYANELLLRSMPEADPHPRLFNSYQQLVLALATPATDVEPLLRGFERILLEEMGYGIDFRHEADSGDLLQPGLEYQFVAGAGFVPADSRDSSPGPTYPGAELLRVGMGQFEAASTRTAAKQLMRAALVPLLGDKPLNSRMLYRPAAGVKPATAASGNKPADG
jgi:DNA repair protein RecO (recombination protein O)